MTDEPRRLQRKRTAGWRAPEGAVYVGRPTKWGNPYKVGETLVRSPAIDGGMWELEGRIKTPGEHAYRHPDGTVTWHQIETASIKHVMELYRRHLRATPDLVEAARTELAGRDLMCWCPLPANGELDLCHADLLLAHANPVRADDLIGADPDWIGGMDVDEYIDMIRR